MAEPKNPTDLIPRSEEELRKFVERAESGDASTLPALREMMKNAQSVDELGGDLARQAELSLIHKAAGKNLPFREALTRKMELLRAELAGPNPSPIERLLVERVVACWLQLNDADIRLDQNETKWSIAQGEYHQRSRDRAHKRYLHAIKTLALVRKLALPVLQVNIARKQVNVAGTCPAVSAETTKI